MLPSQAVRLELGTLLAADAGSLAPAALANKIALIAAPFALSENLVIGDLTLANFDGATPIAGAVGTQLTGLDPTTFQQIVTIKDPAGGYRWITTGLTHLPQTIYGFALTNNAGTVLLAAALLPVPVTLTIVGQQIDLGPIQLVFNLQPIS